MNNIALCNNTKCPSRLRRYCYRWRRLELGWVDKYKPGEYACTGFQSIPKTARVLSIKEADKRRAK